VAAGTGALTDQLAGTVLDRGGEYVATDVSAAMLAHARRDGVRLAVADAARLPMSDGSVDVVVCSLGPVQDGTETLVEARRVLAPGGWLVLSTWGDDYAELRLLTEARRRMGLPPRPVVGALQLAGRLEAAGLVAVVVEATHLPVVHDSVADYLAYRASFGVVPDLTPEQSASVNATITECAEPYLDADGRLVLDWHVLVARGRRG
jgi:SAM-dependent methyltransferase